MLALRAQSAGVLTAHSSRRAVPAVVARRRAQQQQQQQASIVPALAVLPAPRRRAVLCAASADNNGSNGGDSDLAYVAKLALFSFVGAAVIKYGSLLIALPHEPNLAVALGAALGTPLVYGAWLLTRPPPPS